MKYRLAAYVAIFTMTVGWVPASLAAAGRTPFQAVQTGQIKGELKEKCGQEGALPTDLLAHLVDRQGTPVPGMSVEVARDLTYAFNDVAPGMYTVQIRGTADTARTLGTTAVTVNARQLSKADVTVGDGLCAGFLTTKKLLIAAALVGGGVLGVIATRSTASPSH